jgi:GPH family glycoside/pentoside/hexuronide:cation symporter
MMADVAFYDQWKTGQRREAIYTATASWLYKVALSLSGVLGGALLVAIGFDVKLQGNQSDFTKAWLVIGLVLAGVLPALIQFTAIWLYPLSPEVMERCRREIDERDKAAES